MSDYDEWTMVESSDGGHSGPGWYAYATDYPDEGSVYLGADRDVADAEFASLPRSDDEARHA